MLYPSINSLSQKHCLIKVHKHSANRNIPMLLSTSLQSVCVAVRMSLLPMQRSKPPCLPKCYQNPTIYSAHVDTTKCSTQLNVVYIATRLNNKEECWIMHTHIQTFVYKAVTLWCACGSYTCVSCLYTSEGWTSALCILSRARVKQKEKRDCQQQG